MAVEILYTGNGSLEHRRPEHELEAFFFQLCTLCTIVAAPGQRRTDLDYEKTGLRRLWDPENLQQASASKLGLMSSNGWKRLWGRYLSPYFQPLFQSLLRLHHAIYGGMCINYSFQLENITPIGHDTMLQILEEALTHVEEGSSTPVTSPGGMAAIVMDDNDDGFREGEDVSERRLEGLSQESGS
ncbi:hypothetical protein BV22DRAFT_620534 [Leucogyrophana mollusca]|uniref:Uncharacterized protein n=1 Tax=Leucogyrophana mollusca TaxID=85980 RepID=A0ACB8BCC9_9AGAM|nr:hypothetical protein BV22DRAFT_620534 [Leucogyrophana mollusca]